MPIAGYPPKNRRCLVTVPYPQTVELHGVETTLAMNNLTLDSGGCTLVTAKVVKVQELPSGTVPITLNVNPRRDMVITHTRKKSKLKVTQIKNWSGNKWTELTTLPSSLTWLVMMPFIVAHSCSKTRSPAVAEGPRERAVS